MKSIFVWFLNFYRHHYCVHIFSILLKSDLWNDCWSWSRRHSENEEYIQKINVQSKITCLTAFTRLYLLFNLILQLFSIWKQTAVWLKPLLLPMLQITGRFESFNRWLTTWILSTNRSVNVKYLQCKINILFFPNCLLVSNFFLLWSRFPNDKILSLNAMAKGNVYTEFNIYLLAFWSFHSLSYESF